MNEQSELLGRLRIERAPPPTSGGSKIWLWIVLVALLLAGGAAAWYSLSPSTLVVQAYTVKAPAGPATAASVLDASGYVVARRQATISAKITDKVVAIFIEEGQHINEGFIVAQLDETNYRAGFEQSQAQLQFAKASLGQVDVNLANAERDYQRKKGLMEGHYISVADLDTSATALAALRAQKVTAARNVDVASKGLTYAQRSLDDTIVRAPFDGIVTNKAAQPGEIVSPISAGGGFTRTGICTLVDMNSLEFEIDVNENFINKVTAGQSVTGRLNAYPDWAIPAHVIAVIPTADRSKGTVKVRIGIDQKDSRILPEMGVRVSFLSEAESADKKPAPALMIPKAAVQISGDAGAVYLIRSGDTLERRAVKLGAEEGSDITVLAGVAAGDHIAVGDLIHFADGVKVKVAEPGGS